MSGGVTSAATGGGFVAKAGLHAVSALAYAAGRGGAPACLFVGAGRDVTAHAAVSLLAIGRAHVADAGCIVHSIAAAEGGDDEVTELIVCAHHLAVFVRVTPGSESLHAPAAGAPASAAPVIMTCARLVDAGDWILDATWGMCGGPQRIALLALARNSVLVVCVGGAGHGAVRARLSQSGDSLGALFCARVHEGWCSGGITVAAGTFRGVINVWKTTSAASGAHPEVIAAASASLCGHKGLVTALAWGRDGASVLSGSDDRTVRMWTRRTDTTEAALARACCDVPCDSVAAHVTHDWRHLWTAFGHSGRVWSTAFSPMWVRRHAACLSCDCTLASFACAPQVHSELWRGWQRVLVVVLRHIRCENGRVWLPRAPVPDCERRCRCTLSLIVLQRSFSWLFRRPHVRCAGCFGGLTSRALRCPSDVCNRCPSGSLCGRRRQHGSRVAAGRRVPARCTRRHRCAYCARGRA